MSWSNRIVNLLSIFNFPLHIYSSLKYDTRFNSFG